MGGHRCVPKRANTHAHTRARAQCGNHRAEGAEQAPTRGSVEAPRGGRGDEQGWVSFSSTLSWKLLESFVFYTSVFTGELAYHRAVRAGGTMGKGEAASSGRVLASRDRGRLALQRKGPSYVQKSGVLLLLLKGSPRHGKDG